MVDVGSWHLDGNADAVEFCTHHPFGSVLAVATYTLEEEGDQTRRSGSVSLFSATDDIGLRLLYQEEKVGIFDIKWSPSVDGGRHPLLARADAGGCLALQMLEQVPGPKDDEGFLLRDICVDAISNCMCLCVDWKPTAESLSVGLSDGSISLLTFSDTALSVSQLWQAHQYEVWTTSFDSSRPYLLYSGSDDCYFNAWDTRQNPSNAVFRNTKSHSMGVCCIAQNPGNSNMLLTGSYDEFLRTWDIRSPSKPLKETSVNLGGGIWRIKVHPLYPNIALAACMHNGFAIVHIGNENINTIETYNKHQSLAYGADWQRCSDGESNSLLVATCSFYDRLLCLWKPHKCLLIK